MNIMPSLLTILPWLFAQAANKPAADGGNFWIGLLPFLPMVLLFYFMIWRPNQQQERKRREMLSALKKNDKVLTTAGIYGTVVSVDPDSDKVILRVDDDRGVKLAFNRGSIHQVLDSSSEKEKAAETA
jgi:preprotein translocase subunit YajC